MIASPLRISSQLLYTGAYRIFSLQTKAEIETALKPHKTTKWKLQTEKVLNAAEARNYCETKWPDASVIWWTIY
jgi:hypothetical protein